MTSASEILSGLERGLFSAPAHVLLREVRNSTGFSRRARSADGLAISLYPSRGVWFAGVECKVSRGDWLAELRDPEKSAEIQRFCKYWWIATPPGLVRSGELPETWGLVEVGEKKCRTVTPARALDPEPLTAGFVASVLRNQAGMIRAAVDAALRKAPDAQPVAQTRELQVAQARLRGAEFERDALRKVVADFEAASGVQLNQWADGKRVGQIVRSVLATSCTDVGRVESALEEALRVVREAKVEMEAFRGMGK